MKNFFVSYNKADRRWAEWIAWMLEEAGYTTIVQAWDFLPGGNFVLDMQRAAGEAERTIAVLSPDYLAAAFTQPEWAAAFVQDPTGAKGTLLPVRVCDCTLTGMLAAIVYIDLVGLDENLPKMLCSRTCSAGAPGLLLRLPSPAVPAPRQFSPASPARCPRSGTCHTSATPASRDASTSSAICAKP